MANPMYGSNKFDNQVDNANGDIVHVVAGADGTAIAGAETKVFPVVASAKNSVLLIAILSVCRRNLLSIFLDVPALLPVVSLTSTIINVSPVPGVVVSADLSVSLCPAIV